MNLKLYLKEIRVDRQHVVEFVRVTEPLVGVQGWNTSAYLTVNFACNIAQRSEFMNTYAKKSAYYIYR